MHPNFRRAVIVAVIVASLAPGFVQARTSGGSPRALAVEMGRAGGFFSTVWSLLTDVLAGRVPGASLGGSPLIAKDTSDNGGHLDPNGDPLTTTTETTPPPDNGGHLDPNG
jgi:hypothetical protein